MRYARCALLRIGPPFALLATLALPGCYVHAALGPVTTPTAAVGEAGAATLSSGIAGRDGGVAVYAGALKEPELWSGSLGVEMLRFLVFRGEHWAAPYGKLSLGLLEVGRSEQRWLLGFAAPRAELGTVFRTGGLEPSLSVAVDYRPRVLGPGSGATAYVLLGVASFSAPPF
jgi:hypothetical protein